jgi:H+/Cl- antiporter ClcA
LRIFTLLEAGAKRLPADLRPVLGGVVLAGLGALSPWALTYGETQLGELAGAHLAIAALVAIAALKLVATSVTLASDWKGGFIIPLFFMGATLGQLAHHALPGTNETLLMATMMVALCVGVTKTPLGTTLVVTEMAGLPLLPVTLIAAIVALVLSRPVTLIETQRARHPESRTAL